MTAVGKSSESVMPWTASQADSSQCDTMSCRTNFAWSALKPTCLLQFATNPISNQEQQTETIIDVRITNSDVKSYLNQIVAKHLEAQEKEKKDKYLPLYREQRKSFAPFVAMVDGILGQEAKM
eukprot:14737036-Ditylum_brightwellii.AAC.1